MHEIILKNILESIKKSGALLLKMLILLCSILFLESYSFVTLALVVVSMS